jgi:hypothetical protein
VESFILLNGVGGECLDDFEQLRADGGLEEMLGYTIPSPEAARNFLTSFTARPTSNRPKGSDVWERSLTIPGENAALHGLGEVNRDLVARQCPDQGIATIKGFKIDVLALRECSLEKGSDLLPGHTRADLTETLTRRPFNFADVPVHRPDLRDLQVFDMLRGTPGKEQYVGALNSQKANPHAMPRENLTPAEQRRRSARAAADAFLVGGGYHSAVEVPEGTLAYTGRNLRVVVGKQEDAGNLLGHGAAMDLISELMDDHSATADSLRAPQGSRKQNQARKKRVEKAISYKDRQENKR